MITALVYYFRRLWWSFFSKGTSLTLCIVATNCAVYGLQLYWQHHFHSDWFIESFSLSKLGLFKKHYWVLFTHAWLHDQSLTIGGLPHHINFPLHLIVNMLMVLFFGRQLEPALGPVRFLVLYLGGVLASALAWLYTAHMPPEDPTLLLGASGAIFALLFAYAVFDPKRSLIVLLFFIIPIKVSVRTLTIFVFITEIIFLRYDFVSNFMQTLFQTPDIQVAHMDHLGGAVFGFLIMTLWRVRATTVYPIVISDSNL